MSKPTVISTLSEFLSDEEIKGISAVKGHARPHPVHLLLEREDGRSQHRANVDRALKQVSLINSAWLNQLKARVIGANHADASAALAEIRAHGALLEAGFSVQPVPTSKKATPEFLVKDGEAEFVVEVHAKQQNLDTEKELEVARKTIHEEKLSPGEIRTHVAYVHPWGRPRRHKKSDSTTTNAISKICSIKENEHQLRADIPSIVWMDFQDLHSSDMALTPDQFRPIMSSRENLTSGAIYYALYGWNGAPVYEELHYSHLELPSQIQWMMHDGRFLLSDLTSAVIVSLPAATILAETPKRSRQLPSAVRLRCLGLPHFGMQDSIAEWIPGLVGKVLTANAELICGLVEQKVPVKYIRFARDVHSATNPLGKRIAMGIGAAFFVGLAVRQLFRRKSR